MSKQELLAKYKKDVEILKERARNLNLSDEEIDKLFDDVFKSLQKSSVTFRLMKIFIVFIVVSLITYILLNVHQATSSIVLRNVQGLIYPGMKFLRSLSVPVIKQFPSLTYLYDESCLLENPYFYVSDMECWPCENVHSVIDLTGFNNHSLYQSGIPYIVKTQQKEVSFNTVRSLYINNSEVFDNEANSIRSNNPVILNIQNIQNFTPTNLKSSKTHISWRINRMTPARLIRSLFPRPYIISEWSGQSIERYIMIDEPHAEAYSLPNMECSYVFVIQGSGERTIILKPSQECNKDCKTVSVTLKPSYVLWYNWWYWRPISLPIENSTESSVTYISSYC